MNAKDFIAIWEYQKAFKKPSKQKRKKDIDLTKLNLAEVFQAMEKSSESVPADKDNAQLKAYFEKTYPDLDFSRVYTSDLKKMVKWYNVLKANNVEIKVRTAEETQEEEAPVEPVAQEAPVETPAPAKTKKASAKKGRSS